MSATTDARWDGPLSSEERAELAALLDRWCWKFDAAAAGCDLLQIGIALRCTRAATEIAVLYHDVTGQAESSDDLDPEAERMARADTQDR